MNINNSNINFINYKNKESINNIKILTLGFLISLILVSITFYLSIIQYNETFDLGPILLNIIIYIILFLLIRSDTLLYKWIVIGYVFRCMLLLTIFCLSLAFSQDAFLLADDKMYYAIARKSSENLLFNWESVYGSYYIKILEIIYRIFGEHTINGRLINIFLSLLLIIIFYKFDEDINIYLKEKILKFMIFFPELAFFSLFEFKDYIFSFFLCLSMFLLFKSYKATNIFLKLIFIIISFGLSLINSYIRIGVPIYFFIFGVIAYLIISLKKGNAINIKPILFLMLIFVVGFLFFQVKDFLVANEYGHFLGISGKINLYFSTLELRKEASNLMKYFIVDSKMQIYKLPISFVLLPYSPINFFDTSLGTNMFIYSILRIITFFIYFYFLINLFFLKFKIKNCDFYFLFLPCTVILIILTITNAGIFRHYLFILPFIVYLFSKYINFQKGYLFVLLGSAAYSIYFLFYLITNF